jgi:folate-binding protein YgfZ
MNRLPLHHLHQQAGAVFVEHAGMLVPQHYGDEADEYRAALEGAVVFDLSDRGKVEVRGPDARMFLHNLCTQDVKQLPAGAGCEAFLTTNKARVVAHVWISHLAGEEPSRLLLDAVAGQGEKIRQHLDHYLISEQVELADRTAELALIRLCGPAAAERLAAVAGAAGTGLAPLHHRRVDWPEAGACHLRAQNLLGLAGFDIIVSVAGADAVWQALRAAGARPAGRLTHDVLRIEAGLPEYGPDIDDERLAMEVGRTAQAISYAKGCYLGQETIVMARDRGQVNRQLAGVTLPSGSFLAPGTKLFQGADEVGHVTSAVFSPRLGRVAGLAYLRRAAQAPGTELLAEPTAAGRWVTVAALPLVSTGAAVIQ